MRIVDTELGQRRGPCGGVRKMFSLPRLPGLVPLSAVISEEKPSDFASYAQVQENYS